MSLSERAPRPLRTKVARKCGYAHRVSTVKSKGTESTYWAQWKSKFRSFSQDWPKKWQEHTYWTRYGRLLGGWMPLSQTDSTSSLQLWTGSWTQNVELLLSYPWKLAERERWARLERWKREHTIRLSGQSRLLISSSLEPLTSFDYFSFLFLIYKPKQT